MRYESNYREKEGKCETRGNTWFDVQKGFTKSEKNKKKFLFFRRHGFAVDICMQVWNAETKRET
jgi:hypothetical protein